MMVEAVKCGVCGMQRQYPDDYDGDKDRCPACAGDIATGPSATTKVEKFDADGNPIEGE